MVAAREAEAISPGHSEGSQLTSGAESMRTPSKSSANTSEGFPAAAATARVEWPNDGAAPPVASPIVRREQLYLTATPLHSPDLTLGLCAEGRPDLAFLLAG